MVSGCPHPFPQRAAACVTILALAAAAFAAPAAATAPGFARDRTPLPADVTSGAAGGSASHAGGVGSGTAAHMLLALAVVVALVFAVYKLLRRAGRRESAPNGPRGPIALVASAPLGQSQALHLVRVGEELVLVGAAPNGIAPVRVYSADETRRLDALGDTSPLGGGGLYEVGGPTGGRTALDLLRKLTAR